MVQEEYSLGPCVVTLNGLLTTVVLAGNLPIGTVMTGAPTPAANPGANAVGITTASTSFLLMAPKSVASPPKYKFA